MIRVINQTPNYKLIMLADTYVGKTSFITRAVDNIFHPNKIISTIGVDFLTKSITLSNGTKNIDCNIQLWDTAGRESFQYLKLYYYRGTDGFFVMYDITSRKSFENVVPYIDVMRTTSGNNAAMILLGTKLDLQDKRQVSTKEGEELAKSFGMPFFEISSKDDINVKKALHTLAQAAFDTTPPDLEEPQKPSYTDSIVSMVSSFWNWVWPSEEDHLLEF